MEIRLMQEKECKAVVRVLQRPDSYHLMVGQETIVSLRWVLQIEEIQVGPLLIKWLKEINKIAFHNSEIVIKGHQ